MLHARNQHFKMIDLKLLLHYFLLFPVLIEREGQRAGSLTACDYGEAPDSNSEEAVQKMLLKNEYL